jgi:hypothetical protein
MTGSAPLSPFLTRLIQKGLEHFPDRLEHPVAGGDLVQKPVAFDGAGCIPSVERDQVELVTWRSSGDRPEYGDDGG